MSEQQEINYRRIAEAIGYIQANFKFQPDLDEVAKKVHMSPAHFQRMFSEWAGTSPKQFLQYISLQYAKNILKNDKTATLFDASFETGLSSTSRLHDLFIKIEGMTPAEFREGGKSLCLNYNFYDSPFGKLTVASTGKGICYMAFDDDGQPSIEKLKALFPQATLQQKTDALQTCAIKIFEKGKAMGEIKLHLKGTDFQLKVWESLLKIPLGHLATYGSIAENIGAPSAARAVGTAIGSNPVAYLIPCHRVIQATGNFGGYMWGPLRKTALIGWEQARLNMGEQHGQRKQASF